ncbi:major facilitator super transporter protein [Phytophthora pseudosyringae]|uniref:Major facilitator super transporter protein n=1 Tax=Phytophthora pseudosyringae TaxID=221518 RepID=A0A8T1WHD4_9STRA|nr:major facilitator super transporter protein [Phytophthora pseudosyringae]
MAPTLLLRLLCLCAGLGAYLCSSGLLRLNEVFFQDSAASSSDWGAQSAQLDGQQEVDAAYDRLVIVLIDALRADMVLGSSAMRGNEESDKQPIKGELNAHMPFTSGLVTSGRALGYVAHASVPTVTMPRLKALVTGKAPAFIDILKNFNSAALDEDANLVSLLKASGKRIVFYGDDTWLKLFPETFKRSDGTSGFYTRDTVEVDNNVTRHLSEELDPTMQNEKSADWDALVLHYLGLDHVGHLRGPRSPLMKDKLQEMDGVVKLVVDSVREQDAQRMKKDDSARPSLILLCSDHGMSEVGNHGGATLEESSALLMFMRGDGEPMHSLGDVSYNQKRSQVDLVPTIASLFGLPIPLYSTGLLLDDVVRASSDYAAHNGSHYFRALYRNFEQLHALSKIKFHASALTSFDQQFEVPLNTLHESLQGYGDDIAVNQQTADAVFKACETLQAMVAQSDGSEYDSTAIFSGLVLLLISGIAALKMLANAVKVEAKTQQTNSHLLVVLGTGSILQIASLSSSSSIENEHATAFFMAASLLVAAGIIFLRQNKANGSPYPLGMVGLLLVITRMLRARNQIINFWRLNGLEVDTSLPGNEFATDDSVSILSTAPVLPSSTLPLSMCVALICAIVLRKAAQHTKAALRKGAMLDLSVGVSSGFLFVAGMMTGLRVKVLSDQPAVEADEAKAGTRWSSLDADASARVVYASVISLAVLAVVAERRLRLSLVEMVIWLLVGLLQRGANFPTLCLLCLQLEAVSKLLDCEQAAVFRHRGVVLAGLALWLSQAAFFALGNSHLVTTIDISQSYHGLSSYSQSLVGALTFVSVFSGPLVCFVSLFQWLEVTPVTASTILTGLSSTGSSPNTRRAACLTIFTYQTLRFAVYTVVVYFMRFHLFIWSVFAPKMLYEFANLAVSLVLASLLASPSNHRGVEQMTHEL